MVCLTLAEECKIGSLHPSLWQLSFCQWKMQSAQSPDKKKSHMGSMLVKTLTFLPGIFDNEAEVLTLVARVLCEEGLTKVEDASVSGEIGYEEGKDLEEVAGIC